jgi:predicted TIM-barrel fold metal-dependent hydrolase
MLIIDAQIHLWTGERAPPHHWRAPNSMERALADMDEAGVHRAVNCPAIWDPVANDYAVEAALAHPDRFATLGWFPLDTPTAPEVLDAFLARPGMLGLRFVLSSPERGAQLANGELDWLWSLANARALPMGIIVSPDRLPALGEIARRFRRMRLLVDHLAVGPFTKLPEAASAVAALNGLARHPNIAAKATGVPSMATDDYPFASTHDVIRSAFDAFGPDRLFWGTDFTRMRCSWRECMTHFTENLPWLKGRDLERVMGAGIADWIGWR